MLVAIHQPNLLPRAKTVDKLLAADLVIYLDNVQYVPREWQNRTRIRRQDGQLHWLSVPVISRGKGRQNLLDCVIDDSTKWRYKHLETMRYSYGNSEWWACFDELVAPLWDSEQSGLAGFVIESMERTIRCLGHELKSVRASQFDVGGRRTERLAALCEAVGATGYITGSGGMSYLDIPYMNQRGIEVYRQLTPEVPEDDWFQLSLLDPIMRIGPQATSDLLLGRRYEEV